MRIQDRTSFEAPTPALTRRLCRSQQARSVHESETDLSTHVQAGDVLRHAHLIRACLYQSEVPKAANAKRRVNLLFRSESRLVTCGDLEEPTRPLAKRGLAHRSLICLRHRYRRPLLLIALARGSLAMGSLHKLAALLQSDQLSQLMSNRLCYSGRLRAPMQQTYCVRHQTRTRVTISLLLLRVDSSRRLKVS